ncbi:MAG: PspC domain-containing protein [Propionibacteriaceae bacterium]|nr:PspC domain-containing protein [Propionibacteriaceae bacterium]
MGAPDTSDSVDSPDLDQRLPAPIEVPADEAQPETPPAEPADDAPKRPRAARVADGAWLGGVCSGLADHLGWPVMVLRIGFVALALVQFVGLVVYAVLWLALPPATAPESAPGLESHDRTNLRTVDQRARRKTDVGTVLALALLAIGLLWLVQATGMGLSAQVFWPIAFAGAGVALVWRTADDSDAKWREKVAGPGWLRPFVARGRMLTLARTVLGLGLVGAAVGMVIAYQTSIAELPLDAVGAGVWAAYSVGIGAIAGSWAHDNPLLAITIGVAFATAVGMVIASQTSIAELPRVFAMTGLALAGTGLVIAPWAYRSRQALQEAREDKVRADARADMAAHLHDSVLQTLALIQKRADDPRTVATLARKQERELRTYLYGDVFREKTLKAALSVAAAQVDDDQGVPVEIVCVGDCELTEDLEAMIRAAREAMTNAAKHSGAPRIDVYAEVDDAQVEIFVRDRGKGFDLDAIGDDRMGVKGSIIGRMERHGGSARIRSSAEDGTEVKLEMKR